MIINKDKLKKALDTVKPGLSKQEIIDQSNCFAFKNGRVITYNDEMCFSHPVEEVDEEFAIVSDELYKFLDKVKTDEINITLQEDSLILRAGRSKAGFPLKAEVLFPLEEELSEKGEWYNIPGDFLKAIKFAASSCSEDMSDPMITCVHITKNGIVEGTDNYRISYWDLKQELPIDDTLVPADSVMKLLTIKPTQMSCSIGWLHFKNESRSIASCRVFSEKYPNTAPFIKERKSGTKVSFPDGINEILDRAQVFIEKEDTFNKSVTIISKANSLIVESESDRGWFHERVPMSNGIGDAEFIINPLFLKDILKESTECILDNNLIEFRGDHWVYLTMLKMK